MDKKIGILTQPLHDNYGGLLQAYALKEVLNSLGHEVVVINRHRNKRFKLRIIASIIKNRLKGHKLIAKDNLPKKQREIISAETIKFREKYIPCLSHLITNNKGMSALNKMGFQAYVVGSDQCWRPRYSPKISNYFLDFAENEKNIKRIGYAVSFGVSEWEFSQRDTKKCSSLAKKFDAISVREESGVKLVKDYFGKDAVHLLDPTLLLPKEHYIKIADDEKQTKSPGNFKVYILDKTPEKERFINEIEEKTGLRQFQVLPKKRIGIDPLKNIEDFIFPNPSTWLRGYQDAEFVITDSFHGVVFAILFNIPFIALGNKKRGMARFESLLKLFGLENRLIANLENYDALLQNDIDWSRINSLLLTQQQQSLNFLKNNL